MPVLAQGLKQLWTERQIAITDPLAVPDMNDHPHAIDVLSGVSALPGMVLQLRQIEDLKRRAERGSQQLQGELQELELEALLAARFPTDSIQPVRKDARGGHVMQGVVDASGQACGSILWENKMHEELE